MTLRPALLCLVLAACTTPPDQAEAASTAALRLTSDQVFESICSRCHGPEGRGGPADDAGVGPRNFHDHAFQTSRTDAELTRVIREGKSGRMPPFGTAFDDAQLAGLVRRIRSYDPGEDKK
jgi:mono/diheme cytochrome c family protein